MTNPLQDVFSWLSSAPSLLFGQKEPAGTRSTTGYSQGIDIPLGLDTPIANILPGKVVEAGYFPWGGQVDIESLVNGIPTVTEYLHLDTLNVQKNQDIGSGTVVGLSGGQLSGGSHPAIPAFSTGPHIKFSEFVGATQAQINAGQWGQAIDPTQLLQVASNIFGSTGSAGLPIAGPLVRGFGGATNIFELFSNLLSFITSVRMAKIVIGSVLLLLALVLFLAPTASKVADTAAPLAALAA